MILCNSKIICFYCCLGKNKYQLIVVHLCVAFFLVLEPTVHFLNHEKLVPNNHLNIENVCNNIGKYTLYKIYENL